MLLEEEEEEEEWGRRTIGVLRQSRPQQYRIQTERGLSSHKERQAGRQAGRQAARQGRR